MRLYNSYLNVIQQAIDSPTLQKGHDMRSLSDAAKGEPLLEHRIFDPKAYEPGNKLEPTTSMSDLARLLGLQVRLPQTGDHPDFIHLRSTQGVEYHHITSMFMDVKNSTNFFRKYTLEQIRVIIQVIVSAATHTCALFGGHIQRMQYDGVFAYFGGRNVTREQGVINAIRAASFFSYFVKYELPEVFESMDVDNIYTRTGIDFGDDDVTLWSIYGTGGCTELTTTSLHTSLAPKMQHCATSNGIMLGDNAKQKSKLDLVFFELKRTAQGNVDENERYIFKDPADNFYYTQYRFLWEQYLKKTFDFIKADSSGKLFIEYKPATVNQSAQRLQTLSEETRKLESGQSSLDKKFNIISGVSGVAVPRERDHYDPSRRS